MPDNLKSAVIKSSKYEPLINETFADFAEHYATVVLPARSYRPKDKALVEGMVKIVYKSIHTAINTPLPYTLLEALNAAVSRALELLNMKHQSRTLNEKKKFQCIFNAFINAARFHIIKIKMASC